MEGVVAEVDDDEEAFGYGESNGVGGVLPKLRCKSVDKRPGRGL